MLNYIWFGFVIVAVVFGGINGKVEMVTAAAIESAGDAVTLAIGLVGIMALWLGLMKIAEDSGLVRLLARAIAPVLRRIFPEIPAGHPAMGSMIMNMAANSLGLSNAATPLGLRAMKDLESLNPHPGVATNAMCMFLAINTAGVQLIPATMVGVMAAAGAKDPTAIIGTTIVATGISLVAAVVVAKAFESLRLFSSNRKQEVRNAK